MIIAGVDEVGRGPLAGDVFAGAVVLDIEQPIEGLADSKKLTPAARTRLHQEIRVKAVSYAVARASVEEIDRLNILQASLLAMKRAVDGLSVRPDKVLVDGNQLPRWRYAAEAIVDGDGTVEVISAASIIAKVARDQEMVALDKQYPGYGFASHKGYGTRQHLAALQSLGACPIHRRSFSPVRLLLCQDELF